MEGNLETLLPTPPDDLAEADEEQIDIEGDDDVPLLHHEACACAPPLSLYSSSMRTALTFTE